MDGECMNCGEVGNWCSCGDQEESMVMPRKVLSSNNVPPHGRCMEMLVQVIPSLVQHEVEWEVLADIQNGLNCSLEEARCLLRMAQREFPRSLRVKATID